MQYEKIKKLKVAKDNIFNTGKWKLLLFEICLLFIQCYPSLIDVEYVERGNQNTAEYYFQINNVLLIVMLIVRGRYLLEYLLRVTHFRSNRA